jgi:WD40 repeat protein
LTGTLEHRLDTWSFTYPLGLAWSPQGDRLAVAGFPARTGVDPCVEVWNPSEERVVLTYSSHEPHGDFLAVAWSPDGRWIASSGFSIGIHVWDATTGERLAEDRGHKGLVSALGWSPDGTAIASGGRDGYVRTCQPASLMA